MSNINFSEDMLIAKMLSGSHAYGMALPTSDIDIRGIFVAPPRCIRTPFFSIKEQNIAEEEDTKYYELNQLVKLAIDCNPNIIELIWCDSSAIILDTPEYRMLREAAPKLLSSKIAFTTSGYALSQLKNIKNKKKHITNLPEMVRLCEILSDAYKNNKIDEDWILTQCGHHVLVYLQENKML